MGVDEIVKSISDKEGKMKKKVHEMEKELVEVYAAYTGLFGKHATYEPDKASKYEMKTEPMGDRLQYKIEYKEMGDLPEKLQKKHSGTVYIREGMGPDYSLTSKKFMDVSYISTLQKLKQYMTEEIEKKDKELDDLEKKLFG